MARRKSKGRSSSKGRGERTRSATKKQVQRSSKRTTVIRHSKRRTVNIKTRGRRGSKPTIYYEEDYYEEEW